MKAYYTVGRELLGVSEIAEPKARSVAYLCDRCGTPWAAITIEGTRWGFEFSRCEKHAEDSRMRIGGSLLRWPDMGSAYLSPENQALAIENLPPKAVEREFVLHMNWHARNIK